MVSSAVARKDIHIDSKHRYKIIYACIKTAMDGKRKKTLLIKLLFDQIIKFCNWLRIWRKYRNTSCEYIFLNYLSSFLLDLEKDICEVKFQECLFCVNE